jgi:ABC-2 type transport system permease protein
LRTAYATFMRNWLMTRRAYPWSFFFGALLGGLFTVASGYFIYHAIANGELGTTFGSYAGTTDYMSFLILGTAVYLFTVRILLGVSRGLITERRQGTLAGLMLTPAQQGGYFAGVAALWVSVSLGELGVLLLITWPLGLHLVQIQPLTFALALPVSILGLFGLATVMGAIMLLSGDTYIVQNTLFIAMALMCGFTFPTNYLPLPIQWIAAALPVTGDLHLLRAALLEGDSPGTVLWDLIVYAILGLIYTVVGLWLVRRAVYRVLEGVS